MASHYCMHLPLCIPLAAVSCSPPFCDPNRKQFVTARGCAGWLVGSP